MPRRVDVSQIDTMAHQFAAVTVGRQAGRAGVMSAISATVLAPLITPLTMSTLSDTPPPTSFSVLFALIMGVFAVVLSTVAYRLVYLGSPRLLRFTTRTLRIFTPLTYLYLLVPLVMLSGAVSEPLLVLYSIALSISSIFLIRFVRWTKAYATDWRQACAESPPHVLFPPNAGRSRSFMFREIFSMPPGWLVSRGRTVKVVALIAVALLLEGLAVSYVLQSFQHLNVAMRFDLPHLGELADQSSDGGNASSRPASPSSCSRLVSSGARVVEPGTTRRASGRRALHGGGEDASDTPSPLTLSALLLRRPGRPPRQRPATSSSGSSPTAAPSTTSMSC